MKEEETTLDKVKDLLKDKMNMVEEYDGWIEFDHERLELIIHDSRTPDEDVRIPWNSVMAVRSGVDAAYSWTAFKPKEQSPFHCPRCGERFNKIEKTPNGRRFCPKGHVWRIVITQPSWSFQEIT